MLTKDGERAGVNFTNIIRTNFLYKRRFGSFYYVLVTRKKLLKQCLYEKFAHITLMKLTTGVTKSQLRAPFFISVKKCILFNNKRVGTKNVV